MVKDRLARLRPAIERELREIVARRRQREAELAQRTLEAHFRAIMETATEGVVSADRNGRIIYVNPATERMFGYSSAELLNQPLAQLMPDRFQQAHGRSRPGSRGGRDDERTHDGRQLAA
jgi:PAS domain S-box-containing protein